MEESISINNLLCYIKTHPGIRKREIPTNVTGLPYYTGLIQLISKLEREGYIISRYYSDPANMEYYDKFYISAKGEAYIHENPPRNI